MSDVNIPGQVPVGSNLFEMIEFTLTRKQPQSPLLEHREKEAPGALLEEPTLFGVNVAKVREVIRLPSLEPALGRRPEVLGVFQLRGIPVPAIHLSCALGFSNEPVQPSAQVLVTEFSGRLTGFVVASARRIRRVSWSEVLPPQKELLGAITGMMLDEKQRFVFILDFEKILAEVEGPPVEVTPFPVQQRQKIFSGSGAFPLGTNLPTSGFRPVVVVVDDSSTARKSLVEVVSGFDCDVHECVDGQQAWEECLRLQKQGASFMVISDIEMPRMDGYSFAR
ncbi:chemotaxis signal transduction protein CheV, partial [bacterium]|nr:chemotaxis signal transduction protein CheV [bacterium]